MSKPKSKPARRVDQLRRQTLLQRRRRWMALGVILLAALVCLCPVLRGPFLNLDDQVTLARNRDFVAPAQADLLHYWTAPYMNLYAPLTYTAWSVIAGLCLDPQTHQLAPLGFHLANLLTHLVSAAWVYGILLLLMREHPHRLPSAGIGSLLFAIHPLQVEPVAWITGFNTVLSGMLCLGAIWFFLRFVELRHQATSATGKYCYALALLLCVMSLLAKPAAIVAPMLAWTLAVVMLHAPWRRCIVWLIPWVLATLPIMIIAHQAQPGKMHWITPLHLRPLVAGDALAFYLGKLLVPLHLAMDYGRTPQIVIAQPMMAWRWLAPTGILAAAWFFRHKVPALLAGFAVFALAFLPVLGLVWFDHQAISTVADRYAYVAMLGAALAAAAAMDYLLRRPRPSRIALGAAAALLILLGTQTFRQSLVWQSDQSLCDHEMAVMGDSLQVHRIQASLATLRVPCDTEQAIAQCQLALRIYPDDPLSHKTWGNMLALQNHPDQALEHWRIAAQFTQPTADLCLCMGTALAQTGQLAQAIEQFQHAVQLDPNFALAHSNLATLLMAQGDYAGASAHFQRALAIDPHLPQAQAGWSELLRLSRAAPATRPLP